MATIYFATNRNVKHETSKNANNFGDRFNADGPQCYRVGEVEVEPDGTPNGYDDDAWSIGRCELYPEKLQGSVGKETLVGSAKMFDRLRTHLQENQTDVIILLHGFANDFQNSAMRAAQLQSLYGDNGRRAIVVLFSWPSNGKVQPAWNYFSDRDDAEASGLAMGRALMRLVNFLQELRREDEKAIVRARRAGEVPEESELRQCGRKLHLVAHSMGNWALRHAVRKFISENNGRIPRIFDNVFLMAADEDEDALADHAKLAPLTRLANMVHVYHAANDVALEVSDKTKGNPDRLGSDGPENIDRLNERIMTIDCGRVSRTTLAHGNHQYYRLRKEVVEDVIATLEGQPQVNRPGRVETRDRGWYIKEA